MPYFHLKDHAMWRFVVWILYLSMVEPLGEEGVINPLMIETREDKATFRIVPGIATSSGAEQIARRLGFSNEDVDNHLRNKMT